jgi:hypothetical protein
MKIHTIPVPGLEHIFVEKGLHLKDFYYSDDKWSFKVYLDNGQGYGEYYIQPCKDCFDAADVILHFKTQCISKYPEIFREKGKE